VTKSCKKREDKAPVTFRSRQIWWWKHCSASSLGYLGNVQVVSWKKDDETSEREAYAGIEAFDHFSVFGGTEGDPELYEEMVS
jgi:hypothetical protein